jgi:SAM-dependent methyltransferase
MSELPVYFDDAAAYEAFMRGWSRAAGEIFIDWLAPPQHARWLDVGCGTGVFTQLILDAASPGTVLAVDPAPVQIEHARSRPVGRHADFRISDAQALPFAHASFDIVVAALAINFIPDRSRGLAEMRRVACAGGMVAGYVWDFEGERSPGSPLRLALEAIGVPVADLPGVAGCGLDALRSLFERAGLAQVETRTIDVTQSFAGFEELWQALTPKFGPRGQLVADLPASQRARLLETLRSMLPSGRDGKVAYSARAHAVKARVPRGAQ